MSNSSVDRSEKRRRPVGLRLAILFIALSAAVGLFVSIASLWEPFAVPFHLMEEPDFPAPHGLVRYVLRLVFILLFNVPLLYGGITTMFDLGNVAACIVLTFVSVLFGIAGWGLYGLKNWARLFTLLISTVECLFRVELCSA